MIEQAILWINTIAEKQGEGIVIWMGVVTIALVLLIINAALPNK